MNRADQLDRTARAGEATPSASPSPSCSGGWPPVPEAIYQSLERRRERLERRVADEKLRSRAAAATSSAGWPSCSDAALDELEDARRPDRRGARGRSRTLSSTHATRRRDDRRARDRDRHPRAAWRSWPRRVRRSGHGPQVGASCRSLLHDDADDVRRATARRRKLIIFTEHRDTLNYLRRQDPRPARHATRRSSRSTAASPREERRKRPGAASPRPGRRGPGRHRRRRRGREPAARPPDGQLRPALEPEPLEQRFGRIHRIGQTEVCHLWNLVAEDTREGEVFQRLLEKLEEQRTRLQGPGLRRPGRGLRGPAAARPAHRGDPVRRPARGARPPRPGHRRRRSATASTSSCSDRALACDVAGRRRCRSASGDDMEEAAARRLQPHYVRAFFAEAFDHLGGRHEPSGRPAGSRSPTCPPRSASGTGRSALGAPVLRRYERVCFEREHVRVAGQARRPSSSLPATRCSMPWSTWSSSATGRC